MSSLALPRAVLRHAQEVADLFSADAAEILAGRAGLLGIAPHEQVSAGGATRLLAARDGWSAVTLSRPDDVAAVPAMLGADVVDDPWVSLARWASRHDAAQLVERARLLGIPAAVLGETPATPPHIQSRGSRVARPLEGLLVADLSSMWAGPLCGQLLVRAGATVVKVESPARPDGTRAGAQRFFDWMNSGKLSYAASFDDPGVAALLAAADVVIEASRPAALTRRGLGPESLAARAGQVWLRLTGHGAHGAHAEWVAFGDDAAVSGGLVEYRDGTPVFLGDAIADPLTGLEAARAVSVSLAAGGGELIEISMAAVAASYATDATGDYELVEALPPPTPAASALGADNDAVARLIAGRTPC